MGPRIALSDISALPIDERLDLVEKIWDTIIIDPDRVPVPTWHIEALDRRLTDHANAPMDGAPLEEVERRFVKSQKK